MHSSSPTCRQSLSQSHHCWTKKVSTINLTHSKHLILTKSLLTIKTQCLVKSWLLSACNWEIIGYSMCNYTLSSFSIILHHTSEISSKWDKDTVWLHSLFPMYHQWLTKTECIHLLLHPVNLRHTLTIAEQKRLVQLI